MTLLVLFCTVQHCIEGGIPCLLNMPLVFIQCPVSQVFSVSPGNKIEKALTGLFVCNQIQLLATVNLKHTPELAELLDETEVCFVDCCSTCFI